MTKIDYNKKITLGLAVCQSKQVNKEPLVFDLNNDGELSVTSSESGIYFDYKQDGFLEKTPWAAEGDEVYHNFSGTALNAVPERTPNSRHFAQNAKPLLKNIA